LHITGCICSRDHWAAYWRSCNPAARLLAEAGELEEAAAALAGYALRVVEQAAAGLKTTTVEVAAARWLDAEDAMMRQAGPGPGRWPQKPPICTRSC
jgi:hypothetical protein